MHESRLQGESLMASLDMVRRDDLFDAGVSVLTVAAAHRRPPRSLLSSTARWTTALAARVRPQSARPA